MMPSVFWFQRVCTVAGDVSAADIGDTLCNAVKDIGKSVDILINCAGITHTGTLLDTPNKIYQVSVAKTHNCDPMS